MPELPEVEHLRRTLVPLIVGRTIAGVRVMRRDVVVRPGDPAGGFSRSGERPKAPRVPARELLAGTRIEDLQRHGKQLAIIGANGRTLCVHLGMSGALLHHPGAARVPLPPHTHVLWRLDDASRLLFRDPRRFGGLWSFASPDDLRAHRWSLLGPDALTITARALHARLVRTSRPLKAALLDQATIAGVGNIYADEALFGARLHPARRADTVDPDESAALARAIRTILRRAIEAGGSTLRDYADARGDPGVFQLSHNVYGRAGLPCTRCGNPLEHAVLAQRTTVWCPHCQGNGCPHPVPRESEQAPERPVSSF